MFCLFPFYRKEMFLESEKTRFFVELQLFLCCFRESSNEKLCIKRYVFEVNIYHGNIHGESYRDEKC